MRPWVDLTVIHDGAELQLYGIASVATVPAYRHNGIARALMQHVLAIADAENRGAVLFTNVPQVYEPLGFKIVPQVGHRLNIGQVSAVDAVTLNRLDDAALDRLVNHYEKRAYEGKLIRDVAYWAFYRVMFNCQDNVVILETKEGYVRIETVDGSWWVTEIAGIDPELLLNVAMGYVRDQGGDSLVLAVPDIPAVDGSEPVPL